jgi:hypothetical protein
MVRHEAGRRIDGDRLDLFGRVMGTASMSMPPSVETTMAMRPLSRSTEESEIIFAGDVDAVGDVEALDLLAFGAGLDGDQRLAEHFLGMGADFIDRLGKANAALRIGPSSVNLPLPRPPAWICAFTTHKGPGSRCAAATASSAVIAA